MKQKEDKNSVMRLNICKVSVSVVDTDKTVINHLLSVTSFAFFRWNNWFDKSFPIFQKINTRSVSAAKNQPFVIKLLDSGAVVKLGQREGVGRLWLTSRKYYS